MRPATPDEPLVSCFQIEGKPRGGSYEKLWKFVARSADGLLISVGYAGSQRRGRPIREWADEHSGVTPLASLLGTDWRDHVRRVHRTAGYLFAELPMSSEFVDGVLEFSQSFEDWASPSAPCRELAALRGDGTVVLYCWAQVSELSPDVSVGLCLREQELAELRTTLPAVAGRMRSATLFWDIVPRAAPPWLRHAAGTALGARPRRRGTRTTPERGR